LYCILCYTSIVKGKERKKMLYQSETQKDFEDKINNIIREIFIMDNPLPYYVRCKNCKTYHKNLDNNLCQECKEKLNNGYAY